MGIIGGRLGYWMLRKIAPRQPGGGYVDDSWSDESMFRQFFGDDFREFIQGKTVIDFGCGTGGQSVQMARMGAGRVIGIDIQPAMVERARETAQRHGVADRCHFATGTDERADIIISKDAFEHFDDPAAILRRMGELLKPDGCVLAAFGPTWFHPYGGHLFSVFPWSHLVFTERALIRWRSDFKSDGATCFAEVDGGLNQMTIRRFESIVAASPLRAERLDTLPIKGLGLLRHRALREWGSSIVRCKLTPRPLRQPARAPAEPLEASGAMS